MKTKNLSRSLSFLCGIFLLLNSPLFSQGKIEFGFHYSQWSIDILRPLIEKEIGNAFESEVKDKFLNDIQGDYPAFRETGYSQKIIFDSSGANYGFEIRWYPGGRYGSMSIGLSVEKTTMRVALPEVSAEMSGKDEQTGKSGSFQGRASAEFLLKPLSFHLSFRWDIKPSWVIHPYITLGLGAATGTALEEAKLSYSYSGDLNIEGESPEHYEDEVSKTLKQLKDELQEEGEDFFLPGVIPFVQLNLGLKGTLTNNIHLLLDVGIWNGFLLRGGIALRF